MRSAFQWPSGTRREYLTGTLAVTGAAEGDEAVLGTGALDQEVRGVRLSMTYGALTGGPDANPRVTTRVWLDLVRGEELTFFPLAADARGLVVRPDLTHAYDWMTLAQGPGQPKTIKLKSAELLSPDDAIFDLFADTLSLL